MKNLSLLTLALVAALSFSACTSKDKPEEATQDSAALTQEISTQQAMSEESVDSSVENSIDSAATEVNTASAPLSLGASSSGLGR